MIDSNNNDTEVPEDQPEEQALQLNVKDFAYRSKTKAKPQRREPANYSPSIIPTNARNWIDTEPGEHSLSVYEFSEKVIHLLEHFQKVQREDDGAVQVRVNSHRLLIGLTIDGKHVWQQEKEQKRRYQIQDVISLILHYRTM